jgi:hypothetical protein
MAKEEGPMSGGIQAAVIAAPVRARLAGPGGLYNIGNALGLAGGLGFAVAGAGAQGGLDAAMGYLAGSAAALWITLAMVVFFWGGEVYHRAWARGFPPDPTLNRQGDALSGLGALALGAGLFLTGQPVLAATAGLMHAAGKFGSAWPALGFGRVSGDAFRLAVVASRAPAILLVLMDLGRIMGGGAGSPAPLMLLLACYLIWLRADILLLRK